MAGANKIVRPLHLSQSQMFYMAAEFYSLCSRANNKIQRDNKIPRKLQMSVKKKYWMP
jgi:hypothetical protein